MDRHDDKKKNRVTIISACILCFVFIICIGSLYYRSKYNSHYKNEGVGDFTVENQNIEKIVIGTWDGGSISVISSSDCEGITAKETDVDGNAVKDENRLHYRVTGKTLEIKPCAAYVYNRIFGRAIEKHLLITLPSFRDFDMDLSAKNTNISVNNFSCDGSLRVETVDSTIAVSDCSFDSISMSSSCGGILAEALTCRSLICQTSECDAKAVSVLAQESVKTKSQNGSIDIKLLSLPKNAEIAAYKANISVWIPECSGFSTDVEIAEGTVVYDEWDGASDNASFIWGDGANAFSVISRSSNVILHRME